MTNTCHTIFIKYYFIHTQHEYQSTNANTEIKKANTSRDLLAKIKNLTF